MKVLVHQAIYGEENRGHSLLTKSAGADSVFHELIALTDLPGNVASNIDWKPYLSCFSYSNYFIVSRTFADVDAPRAGMVLAHVLAIKLDDAVDLSEIGVLIDLLPVAPQRIHSLPVIELDVSTDVSYETAQSPTVRGYAGVVNALLRRKDRTQPIVWLGLEDFDDVVKALWKSLWPRARRDFSCRLSFGPQDVEGQSLTLVATPEPLEYRWRGYPTVDRNYLGGTASLAEAFLLGLPAASVLRNFLLEIDGSLLGIADLEKLERAYVLFQSLATSKTADEVRMLTRLLGELSPESRAGFEIKSEALGRLSELTSQGKASDVKALRNFDVTPFKQGASFISESISLWVKYMIQHVSQNDAKEQAELILLGFNSSGHEWGESVKSAVRLAFKEWQSGTGSAVWRWWENVPSLVPMLSTYLPEGRDVEKDLVSTCPSRLQRSLGERVKALAALRKWYVLHAVVLSAYLTPTEAIEAQLKVDKDPNQSEGLRALARIVPGSILVGEALARDDQRLYELAGDACARDPALLASLNVERHEWRKIWRYSIGVSGSPWKGVTDPQHVVFTLMDAILRGDNVEDELLLRLATFPQGDLTEYPRRHEIWHQLDQLIAPVFLEMTAEGWLNRFKANPNFEISIETQLETSILNQIRHAKHFDLTQPNAVNLSLNLFQRFPSLSQSEFESWLGKMITVIRKIDIADSTLIGKLVRHRRWKRIATRLYRYVNNESRLDLVPALSECHKLLDIFDSILLGWSGRISGYRPGWEDWWAALIETAIELYPNGPKDMNIWERSGGDASIIIGNASSRENWEHVIHKLRNGGGGKRITTTALMHFMSVDFPRKDKLEVLWQMWTDLGGNY